jgi:hypothetical protein
MLAADVIYLLAAAPLSGYVKVEAGWRFAKPVQSK